MAKWGNTDFRQLQELQDRINQMMEFDKDEFCRECAKEIAQRLYRRVVKRTPVGKYEVITYTKKDGSTITYNQGKQGGELRKNWKVGAIEKHGTDYQVTVYNPLFYASYVEYGHRQTPGRFVPQIGKKLTSSWAEGQFMLTVSEKEIQNIAPKLVEKKLQKKLEELINGK